MPPDLDVDIALECEGWSAKLENVEAISNAAARCGFEHASADGAGVFEPSAEVCIVLGSDDDVRQLNRDYRGLDKPTNVLSFANLEEGTSTAPVGHPDGAPLLLGDIIIALETVEREAGQENKRLEHHLSHMIVHGMLHLLGYDHESENEAREMEALEVKALAELGINNPYDDQHLSEGRKQ